MQAPPEHVDATFQILAHLFWICIKLTSSLPCWQCCQSLITPGSDHPPVFEPHMVLNLPLDERIVNIHIL
jgi:hypothetical protein